MPVRRKQANFDNFPNLLTLASSTRHMLYSAREAMKIIDDTSSKQWIHFLLSDLWPPTSTRRKLTSPNCSKVSYDAFRWISYLHKGLIFLLPECQSSLSSSWWCLHLSQNNSPTKFVQSLTKSRGLSLEACRELERRVLFWTCNWTRSPWATLILTLRECCHLVSNQSVFHWSLHSL